MNIHLLYDNAFCKRWARTNTDDESNEEDRGYGVDLPVVVDVKGPAVGVGFKFTVQM